VLNNFGCLCSVMTRACVDWRFMLFGIFVKFFKTTVVLRKISSANHETLRHKNAQVDNMWFCKFIAQCQCGSSLM